MTGASAWAAQTTALVAPGCDDRRRESEDQVLPLLCHGRTFLEVEVAHARASDLIRQTIKIVEYDECQEKG